MRNTDSKKSVPRPRSMEIRVREYSETTRTLAEIESLAKEHFTNCQWHRTEKIDQILSNIINSRIPISRNKASKMTSRATKCEDCVKAVAWIARLARDYGPDEAKRFVEEELWGFPKKSKSPGGKHD